MPSASDRLNSGYERVLPDGGFYLETRAGPIECYLEWDRATETQTRLAEKLLAYRLTEARLYDDGTEPRCVVFVVPGARRLQTLRRAYREFEQQWKQRQRRAYALPRRSLAAHCRHRDRVAGRGAARRRVGAPRPETAMPAGAG